MISQKLRDLYQQMANHTRPECGGPGCRGFPVGRCCSLPDCYSALEETRVLWGIDLRDKLVSESQGFLGPNGCVLEPWQRPLCTMHTCQVNAIGHKQGDPAWTDQYFSLRERINDLLEHELDLAVGLQKPSTDPRTREERKAK